MPSVGPLVGVLCSMPRAHSLTGGADHCTSAVAAAAPAEVGQHPCVTLSAWWADGDAVPGGSTGYELIVSDTATMHDLCDS